MKSKFTYLVALIVLVAFVSSCGTTTYRGRRYLSNKFIGHKQHWNFWHAHHYRPHPHSGGGYW